jgi:hypothetical protein
VLKVITQQRSDEVIAVIVAGLEAQRQRVARGLTRGGQQLGAQLRGQEFVGFALVHQQRQLFAQACRDQRWVNTVNSLAFLL